MIKDKYDLNKLNEYVKLGKFSVEKHPKSDIYIYGYTQINNNNYNTIKWDETSINLRGLILDSQGNVLARSFQKFFTFKKYLSNNTILLSENQIKDVNNKSFRIFEKVDGTLTVLYWLNEIPYLATQRSFKSAKAKKATQILHEKYAHTFDKLDKTKTYIFEAIYSETKVLVDYGNEEKLYLLGILDNKTGKDYELIDIGFPLAKEYTKKLNKIKGLDELQKLNLNNMEGFVLKYEDGSRIKIKFPWYEKSHRVFNQIIAYKDAAFQLEEQLKELLCIQKRKLSKKLVWEHLDNNKIDVLKFSIPDIFYSLGVEDWLKEKEKEFSNFRKKQNQTIFDYFIENKDEVFDFDSRINLPESECVVWKRIEKIEKRFS